MFYHKAYTLDPFKPKSLEFGVWSSEDIKKLSVVKVNTYISIDGLGYPIAGGLYDSRLGPLKFQSDPCATCGNNLMRCSGHYGHIELPFPVFNPLFIAILGNILKITCFHCYSIIKPQTEKIILTTQLKLVDAGCLLEARQLDECIEQYSCKQPHEVKEDMERIFATATKTSASHYKNGDELWRHYTKKVFIKNSAKICMYCEKARSTVSYSNGRLYIKHPVDEENRVEKRKRVEKIYLMPMDAMNHMRKLWLNEKELLTTLIKALSTSNEKYPTDLCFISVVPVTPSNTRPMQIVNEKPVEHPKNIMYRRIIQDSLQIRSVVQAMNEAKTLSKDVENLVKSVQGTTINEKLNNSWYSLQVSVNAMLDANALKSVMNTSLGIARVGLKQLIEKKAGILRKNMMGKRVDYFARSVITPDPLLSIYEIGVPETFAKKLTFPTPVTPWNVTELRKTVTNGPSMYPGANIVEAEDGSIIWISATDVGKRASLAKTLLTPKIDSSGQKVVHRHLRDGDMLLINRQPSLHKPSIMAHKARILKGEKTFRLHYANCKAYNADFDGDEMNAHFPQSEEARAEAAEIVNAANQYLVPRDGTPLSGLIQDHVISAFRLSIRDRFFDRREYHQLVFQALAFLVDDIELLPPAILKPKRMWSGKQVISTLVINLTPHGNVPLNLNSKTKVAFNSWPTSNVECDYMNEQERKYMSETNVIIRGGELLCGVLDKNHVGATHYGLVHCFYELYGGQHSANLLSAFSKLFTYYLQKDGFTLGVRDILVRSKADRKRSKVIIRSRMAGVEAAKNALNIPLDQEVDEETLMKNLEIAYKRNSNFRALIDREYKSVLDPITNEINKVCLPSGLLQPFPNNNLQLMVQSGAKGSTVNTMQISCSLGQIELEGKRPPLMISGKSLPCFQPYDMSPMAGGFITSRFMTGLKPQEFFFHCMAGREGLIDTAVKTSRSGYLQRCLVKHLEGLVVNYDLTVRDSDNSVIQFLYGEDGLDVTKSQLLKAEQMSLFVDNLNAVYRKQNTEALRTEASETEIKDRKAKISSWFREQGASGSIKRIRRDGAFLRFCNEVANDIPRSNVTEALPGRSLEATKLCHMWQNMIHKKTKEKYSTMENRCPDPVISSYSPDVHFRAVSENIENMIQEYLKKRKTDLPVRKSKFKDAVYWKSFASLCQPGEAVGVLAAQSVGEPSTQMTLNTFHFAGRGEMNVTLGIPRLREILMVASRRIKTPSMEIPFKIDVPKLEKKAEKLRKSLTRVVLKDVLEKIEVKESIELKNEGKRKYTLKLYYLPKKSYVNTTFLKPRDILKYTGRALLKRLTAMLKKHLKHITVSSELINALVKKAAKKDGSKNEDDEDNFKDYLGDNEINDRKFRSDDDSDDSDAGGDGDATEAKRRNRRIGEDYDDDSESEDEPKSDLSGDENDEEDANLNNSSMPDSDIFSEEELKTDPLVKYGVIRVKHDPNMMWTEIVLWASLSYKRLDLTSLLLKEVETAVIYEVPGIKRAITYVNNDGLLTLKTEGSYGIGELFKYDRLLDLNKLYSNDVHAVAATYGIEAANRVIIREVQDVFKVYGITVDARHLSLIADYMTFDGTYQPLNRTGMDNCSSPLQQMTFESTLKYLKNATVRQIKDNLLSPSSSLIIGRETKIGAGLISLYHCT